MADSDDDMDGKAVAALERVGQGLRVLLQQQATANALSPIQTRVLLRLLAQPESRPVGLAHEFDVTSASLSDTLAALERKGLLVREPHSADRRHVTLRVTESGHTLACTLAGWDRPVRDAVATMSGPDKTALLAQLYDLIAALQRAGVITVARMCITCEHFRPNAHPRDHSPHHCALLDAPLAPETLRIDCPDHQQYPAA